MTSLLNIKNIVRNAPDNLGRLFTHEQRTTAAQLAGTENPYTTSYTYNLSGALLTETYPSGRVVTHNYNSDGELESVWGQKQGQQTSKLYINQITRNSSGAVEKARLGNGNWETAQYNERLQITQIGLGHSATDKSLLKIDYAYGTNTQNNGSLRQQKVNFTGLANEITQNYSYDDLNRLKSATELVSSATSWKQTFNYDRYGNRTFDAANTTTMIDSKATNPDILTSNNRFDEYQDGDSVKDYDYDPNGNLTLDADNQRYVFDAENRIKEFFKSNNQTTNNPNARYEYDGEGKRVRKISDSTETVFVYNAGGTLVAEYSTELNPEPQVSYLTSDHLGSPRIVTGNDGTVISRHDYMAFGDEVTQKLGNVGGRSSAQGYGEPDDVRKQYTGYERDKESGLDYAQARYYNSNHGRFTSVDPLTASANVKDPQTFNRYTYAMNSPYKFTDPLGLISQNTGACGNRCVGYGGGGGGFVGLYSTAGQIVQIGQDQQTQSPPETPPPAPEQNGDEIPKAPDIWIKDKDGTKDDSKSVKKIVSDLKEKNWALIWETAETVAAGSDLPQSEITEETDTESASGTGSVGTDGVKAEVTGSTESQAKRERIKSLENKLNENKKYRRANAVAIQKLGAHYNNAPAIVAKLNQIMIEYATNLLDSDQSPSLPGRMPQTEHKPM